MHLKFIVKTSAMNKIIEMNFFTHNDWFMKMVLAVFIVLFGQFSQVKIESRPIVNQAGYNLYEAKRFVCYGAPDGTKFQLLYARDSISSKAKSLWQGRIIAFSGDFTDFNPLSSKEEYIIRVNGYGTSHPFWIADHLMENLSSRLAYQFFIDVRGSQNPVYSDESKVAGGGPSRDGGAYTLETLYEVLLYASNPALFDRWHDDFNDEEVPDLIKLMLWHAEFGYHHRDYNGPTGGRPYFIGHPGEELQTYDYQNTLDHLAAVCAAYSSFLHPYLSEELYQRYRRVCLSKWEDYERDQVVRYYVKSSKWVDIGWQEFNEMGNVFGQAVFRNLMMYLCEKNEMNGDPEKFLSYARMAAQDMINNWDFNNPRHMWWIRNGEHIAPQALAFFLMVAPEAAPHGTREKLASWGTHMKEKTNNFWHYRKHNDKEWAHPRTKELGNTGLGGSMFAIAHLLDDPDLRAVGWSQVNQVFGMNPAEAHYSNKSQDRLAINGYWKGIETGWPYAHPHGLGLLGNVRGTLDGTPLDNMFPYTPNQDIKGANFAYATEGWAVTNRAWMSTVVFSTLGSHSINILEASTRKQISNPASGQKVIVQLKAALNLDWEKREEAWVLVQTDDNDPIKLRLIETDENTGVFQGELQLDYPETTKVKISYGYLGFEKEIQFQI
jgi:hypothetical protein